MAKYTAWVGVCFGSSSADCRQGVFIDFESKGDSERAKKLGLRRAIIEHIDPRCERLFEQAFWSDIACWYTCYENRIDLARMVSAYAAIPRGFEEV